jgi:two-component system, cell cycle sensor histidine kinase and response regulator CckA
MANRFIRVLHVDDLEEEFILARELLSTVQGIEFQFQWVSDIQTAFQVIHKGKFDVCLVDYYLGPDRGLDFVRAAISNGITIPFILMSGQKDRSVEHEAFNIGVRQCIDKNDITTSILLKAIQDALKNS